MELAEHEALPSGTVTFLQTDIEDSSGWWEKAPEAMREALAAHDALIAQAVRANGGVVVKHLGDGCWAAFDSAPRAAAAAVDFQGRQQEAASDQLLPLRIRIGLHTGEIEPTEGDYFGPVVNRAARIVDLANGNQIVCSASTAGLLPGIGLRNEGTHDLRGIGSEEIFMILADGVETDPEPLRRPIKSTNLPRTHTSFLGRSEDVDNLLSFIERGEPVITLLGPGGVGKTRLAIEAAAGVSASFRGHVYFCDLVPIADADAVGEAVADIVGARRQPGMDLLESIADHLSGNNALVLLDNCEHVIDAARDVVGVLSRIDGVQVLATSREALGLAVEQQLIVDPLSAATAGVELFVDRARQRDPRFELTSDNGSAVRAVVARLDGIPLAIELAAARIRLMTPEELVARLEDGFRVLEGRGHRERHETLRETVRWSFDLLDSTEAALFTRLCVFAGGFDLASVEAVCADDELVGVDEIPDLVMALVDKSMVVSNPVAGRQRFTLLETLRAFAADELDATGTRAAHRRRHADHFLELARTQGDRFWSAAEPDAWRILDAEWTNLRAALDTYEAADELDLGASLVVALVWYANLSMRFEVFSWAQELLETPGIETHPAYTDLCGTAALGAYFTVHGSPTALAEAGLAADPTDPEGLCRATLASVAMNNTHSPEAANEVTTAWLASEPSTVGSRLWAECFRTFYLCTYDPTPEAAEWSAAATKLADETGSITAKALTAWARGQVLSYEDMDIGLSTWRDGLELARSLPGDHLVEHILDGLILHVTVRSDDLLSSLRGCRAALRGALERHYHAGTSHLFGVTAIALCRAGDATTGAHLVGAMRANGHEVRRNARRTLEDALGEELERHMAEGASLGITQAGRVAVDALDAAIARTEENSLA